MKPQNEDSTVDEYNDLMYQLFNQKSQRGTSVTKLQLAMMDTAFNKSGG